ncbi:hypothetical protein [Hydrogenophaga crocea]|uniref:Uncharacterized protein n=1 Tax=Hydrogenophaga crocea TaxID=2716225 RepID=A0A6G8IEJ7_9BURK|nr:hypothetical protein [Hydrogenophaga crocea]QIM51582.1 hypothetical protein G9Q37_05235 [Hydrogenophaga crocea]
MTDQNTDALRCAEKLQGKHPCSSWSEHADDLDSAAAHIRRLVAENQALQAELMEQTRIVAMSGEREARHLAVMRQALEALEACKAKGARWHPCDPAVTLASAAISTLKARLGDE